MKGRGGSNRQKFSTESAVQTHPDLAVGHYNLARLFLEEGKTKEALAAMDQALRVEPDNSEYVNMRARIMGDTGKLSGTTAALVVAGFVGVLVVAGLWARKKGI